MARQPYHAVSLGGGILGTYPQNPEVVGVFPSLSSTVLVRRQILNIIRGDSCDIGIQVQDDQDPPDAIPLSRAVLRFAVKVGFGDTSDSPSNSSACIYKTSADPNQIEIVDATNGKAVLHLRKEDTQELPMGDLSLIWDLEASIASTLIDIPEGATIQLQEGSNVIFSAQNIWTELGIYAGFLFQAQGKLVRVTKVLNSAQLQTDFAGWTTELIPAAAPGCEPDFAVWRALSKTIAKGPFHADGDVVI